MAIAIVSKAYRRILTFGRSYVSVENRNNINNNKKLCEKRFSHKTFAVGFWPVMQARDSIINFLFEFGISLNGLYPVFWMSSGQCRKCTFWNFRSMALFFSQIKLDICLFVHRKSRNSEAFQKCECK